LWLVPSFCFGCGVAGGFGCSGAVLASGVGEVGRALGAGGADPSEGKGGLAATAQAVAALPEAIKEFNQQQLLPQAEAAAGDVIKLAKGVSEQVCIGRQ
jgi:hypothetical protein